MICVVRGVVAKRALILGVLIVATTLEAGIYMAFIHHLHTHNKNMAHILTAQVRKRRHKKTIISFVCELYCFGLECLGLTLFDVLICL